MNTSQALDPSLLSFSVAAVNFQNQEFHSPMTIEICGWESYTATNYAGYNIFLNKADLVIGQNPIHTYDLLQFFSTSQTANCAPMKYLLCNDTTCATPFGQDAVL